MGTNPYQHLDWNPVPGVPSEVHTLQQKVSSAAKSLRNCHSQIQKLLGESSYWEGDAAKKFHDALDGELPLYVKNAARSLEKAAAQLKSWDGNLSSNRDLARKYDEEAGEKKSAADKAKQRHDEARKHPDLELADKQFPSQAEADAATARLRAAESDLRAAKASLDSANSAYSDVIVKAENLETHHAQQARDAAKKLDGATDQLAPQEPGWLSKAVEGIWEGIKAAAGFVLEHAGTIGAIAGLLALLPTPAAPLFAAIGIAASALSMGKNLSDDEFRGQLMGEGTGMETFSAWASVAGDTVGMIPGAKALGTAGKEVASAARTAEGFGETVSAGAKATEFTKHTSFVFKETAAAEAAEVTAMTGAEKLTHLAPSGVNVLANSMSSAESLGLLPEDGPLHDVAEFTKAGVTVNDVAGIV